MYAMNREIRRHPAYRRSGRRQSTLALTAILTAIILIAASGVTVAQDSGVPGSQPPAHRTFGIEHDRHQTRGDSGLTPARKGFASDEGLVPGNREFESGFKRRNVAVEVALLALVVTLTGDGTVVTPVGRPVNRSWRVEGGGVGVIVIVKVTRPLVCP